jgi:LSU ribosomal protein L30P
MTEAVQKMIYPRYAVIRIRGIPTTPRDIATALNLLRLRRKFTMVVVPGTPDVMGMIERANDWITWGEIDADTLAEVLREEGENRGRQAADA